jgi:hypothetical protein
MSVVENGNARIDYNPLEQPIGKRLGISWNEIKKVCSAPTCIRD